MNKRDIIELLREKTGLARQESHRVVNLFFDGMSNALANGDRVEIRGMCSIYVKKYGEYIGRNPKTGKKVKVKKKNLPFFKCGRELMERVDR